MTRRRTFAGLLVAALLSSILPGCASTPASPTRARGTLLPPSVELRLVDDHPPDSLDQRQRVDGPGNERLLLFAGRGLALNDIESIVITPGWRSRQVTTRLETRTFEPGTYQEVHVLLRPHAWGRLTAVRHAFGRVAVLQGGAVTTVLPAVAVREDELTLAATAPREQLAWLPGWDGTGAEPRRLGVYLDWLQKRQRAEADSPELLMAVAEESLLGPVKDCGRGEGLLDELLPRTSQDPAARDLVAQVVACYVERDDHDGIVRSAQHVLERDPKLGNALGLRSHLADTYWAHGNTERAVEELTAYVEFLKRSDFPDKDERITEAVIRIEAMRGHSHLLDHWIRFS
jgi:hypothetical protein